MKQAEIFGDVREKLGVEQDPEFRLADYPTIEALSGWLASRMGAPPAEAAAPAEAPARLRRLRPRLRLRLRLPRLRRPRPPLATWT